MEQRTVLKRYEKVKVLHEKERWKEDTSIFHLPKVKTVRLKIKKAPAQAPKEGEAKTAAAVPAAAPAAAPKAAAKPKSKP